MNRSIVKTRIKNVLQKVYYENPFRAIKSSSDYWNQHNVTLSKSFLSEEESLSYFNWRNDQYFNYIDLMPVYGQDDKVVLDYGCGPGNDLVGFLHHSNPAKLVGCDVSRLSLAEAKQRLSLHPRGQKVEFVKIEESDNNLPFDDSSIDYIHSSGVIHHIPDPKLVLNEFKRVLKPDGQIRIMVYNYESIWLHLYVAYQKVALLNRYVNRPIREAFSKFTDGEACPVSNVYKSSEFIELAENCGLNCEFTGSSVSQHEMKLLPLRFEAIQDMRLREESRNFLMNITFDEKQLPKYQGIHAGIGAIFQLNLSRS